MKKNHLLLLSFLALITLITACSKATQIIQESNETMIEKTDAAPLVPIVTAMIPMDDRVRSGQLANGLKYFIQKNGKPENRAELRLAIAAGSMQEDEDQLGLAHFVEHMAFNGSKNFKKNELVDYLESIGSKFGADLNAYTSFDETVYMLQVRTDEEEQMMKGFLVLEDWAGGLNFDKEEIDKERGVVISEWRNSLSPDQRMQQQYFPILYKNSRYATRLPIGSPDIIKNSDYEVAKRFYKDWYRPNLMAVVVVGDVDVDQIEREIKERFGKLENPANPRLKEKYPVPGHPETLVSITSDKEASFTRVRVKYKHKAKKTETVEDFRRLLTQSLYNSMLNGRLNELTQIPTPPFTFASAGYGGDVGDLATYSSYAFVEEGGAAKGLEAVLTETNRVLAHGFTMTELERTKLRLVKGIERAVKEMDKTKSSRLVSKYVYHFLNGNPIPNAAQQEVLYKKLVPNITLEEVNALAKEWITDENRVVIITGPEKEDIPLPTEAEVLAIFDKVDNQTLTPYEDNISDAPLLTADLQPIAIKDTKYFEEINTTEFTLANGIRVVLKPTEFKNDEIIMRSFSPGGMSLYSMDDYLSAANAAQIINEGGISTFDLPQLQKKLAGKKVGVNPGIGALYEVMNGGCSPDDLETLMQLTYLYFTAPRADEDVLKSFVNKQKSIYKNIFSNPQYWFYNESSKIKYDNHPRVAFPTEAQFDEISIEKVEKIYKERFEDASDFTFFFVGNFEVEQMKEITAKYLGNLPTTNRTENWKDQKVDIVKGIIKKELIRGETPKSLVDITYHGEEYPQTTKGVRQFYMATDLLKIKLRESMREDKGGVYGVGVNGGTSKYPKPSYSINISFNSEPEKVEELIATALNDIETIKKDGVEEKDLNKVKETLIQNRTKNLKENSWWMGKIMDVYMNDKKSFEDMPLDTYRAAIEAITPADIQEAIIQYFNPDNYIQLVMHPEENK